MIGWYNSVQSNIEECQARLAYFAREGEMDGIAACHEQERRLRQELVRAERAIDKLGYTPRIVPINQALWDK